MPVRAAIDVERGFDDAVRNGILLLPKIGYFLLILLLGILVAKVLEKLLTTVLQKAGFDQLVERGGVRQALSKSKYDAAGILARIVYYFIFLFVLSAAFSVFGSNPVSDFLQQIIFFLPKLFVAILVLVIASAVAAAVKDLLSNAIGGLSYGPALSSAASLFILAIGVFAALDQLEIAPLIVGGIYYGLLALIIVPPIIAFGVGGIDPARELLRSLQAQGQQKVQAAQAEASSPSGADDIPPLEDDAAAAAVTRTARARKAPTGTRRRATPK